MMAPDKDRLLGMSFGESKKKIGINDEAVLVTSLLSSIYVAGIG